MCCIQIKKNKKIISSPELKAQVSFSDHLSSVVCLSVRLPVCPSVCLSVCKLFTFSSSSPEPLGQFQPNLATKHSWVKGIQVCSNEGPRPFPRGDNYEIAKNTLTKLKNLLLQNHWANFIQTWHKASLGEGDSSLFKWRPPPFSKGR